MKNMTRSWILLSVISLLLLAPAGCGVKSQTISVSGAFALYPLMNRWAEEYHQVNPQVQFDVSAGGAGKGMADALSNAVDIGMVSRDITPEEEAKGAFFVAVTKDAVFPVINQNNPALADLLRQGVKEEVLEAIYITGAIKTWGEVVGRPELTDPINLYTRSDAAGAPEVWAKYLGNHQQEDLLGVGVFGDPGLLEAVIQDPLGIGYNNLGYAYDNTSGLSVAGVWILPIDADGDGLADPEELIETKAEAVEMVALGKYPSPPARALNLVTKGKPSGVVLAFIQWIITDGQQFVDEAGYVSLPQDQLDAGLQKLQ